MPAQTHDTSHISFRSTRETIRQLRELRAKWGGNRSQAIVRCIERIWIEEIGSRRDPDIQTGKETLND